MSKNKDNASKVRNIIKDTDVAFGQIGQPSAEATSEAAQEEHQAALTSYQTELKSGRAQSLNGLSEAEAAALKNKPKT